MENELYSIGYRVKSREDIALMAPAALSNNISPILTGRYSFFSTEKFLDAFEALGWEPTYVKQNGVGPFARHIIRFRNPELGTIPVAGDEIIPQLILDNSHDGFTKARIHLGLFRKVSGSGLVIASLPGVSCNYKFLHVGVNQKEMMEIIADTYEGYKKVGERIKEMQSMYMSEDDKIEFAYQTIAKRDPERFANEDKTPDTEAIDQALDIYDIFEPVRPQDAKDDLWTLFNVVQERTVKGLFEQKSKKGRKSQARVITNAARNLEFNKELWTLTESVLEEAYETV
jgi:hypothetical protein